MKRIVICADGTWNTPRDEQPTNVITMARALAPKGSVIGSGQPITQVVFYDWGVGTGNIGDKVSGGALGAGLDKNIQDAYRFIVHNYERGDELFFFGFSRGGYTVRSLGGLIRNCGILTRDKAHLIPRAYTMYRSHAGPDVPSAVEFRNRHAHHKDAQGERPTITFMGVWDTVGALGIPIRFLKGINAKKYQFHDTELSSITKNSYHALSIDEKRGDFQPVLWRNKPKTSQHVEQIWFCGVHSNVGGGYAETGLANCALHWMADKAKGHGLGLNEHYMDGFIADPMDKLHRSKKGVYTFKSTYQRAIEKYNAISAEDAFHFSVKKRYQGIGDYRPSKLVEFLVPNNINW
jgi:uncharacterized protein (DUF2235 family)